ncbi:sulfur oxidation c-type cytochrome SoxA [uncultured Ramlibacter sp.]|uniref:sulfur oxidation c-type cytochrome SoxA n=1 Tax=uncultured Ramlibacter sp. TaxID=260755 RepID=UPI0026319D92|nr:sulfur oxidation c-type cytochrome SoxA [uncultured Ramlibacter sp.]
MSRRALATALLAVLLGCAAAPPSPSPVLDARRSSFDFMGPDVQAMQRDDNANPAMLWVQDGQALWRKAEGPQSRSCASCHGEAATSMAGVAARYPAWDATSASAVNLGMRINLCRQRHQQLPAWGAEHAQLLGLETYVAMQSRGLPMAPDADPRLAPLRERGAQLFAQRLGQLDLSCAQCHDQLAGGKLAGSTIPQGHATGYPVYRLEWQGLGSLQRRLRGCLTGVRAEPFAANSPDMVALELHLAARAMGMAVETPAVRP